MNKFKEEAIDYFDRHPLSEECHVTSDGRVFHTKGSAQSMAGTLDDGAIESYSRKVIEKDAKIEDENHSNEITEAQILEKTEFLKTADVEKLEYKEVKALVKLFSLETADQKGETLITALNEYKLTLND